MINIKIILFLLIPFTLSGQKNPTDYVNPFIGTSNGGNTLPGAVVPWGMAYISPHNDSTQKWSGARYFDGQKRFFGYGQIHLSGVGCADLANLVMIPTKGKTRLQPELYLSNEKASAGYYSADISNGIASEVTATRRTTLSKFDYDTAQEPGILFNVTNGCTPSKDAYVQIESNNEIIGYNTSGGFCRMNNSYTIYFVARFSKPFASYGTWSDQILHPSAICQKGTDIGAFAHFDNNDNKPLLIKIGLSYVSIANARENLKKEQPGWDFKLVKENAKKQWANELEKIRVSGGSEDQKTIFYTALYHCLIHPNTINDVNGEYPAMKTKDTKTAEEGHQQFTVYSLWDTYRTLHPLLALVWPDVQTDMVRTMVDMAKHGKNLPFWELGADETYVMNGDPAPIVVADSYVKGLRDFDTVLAINTMLSTAYKGQGNKMRPMNKYYIKHGFLPWDDCGPDDEWGKPRMVSECLEYAYSDWAIAQMAKNMGLTKKADQLEKRSKAYQYYFDEKSLFLRPRYADGTWYTPFKPYGPDMASLPGFVEGNSWQYTFFVPHDIDGLRALMGGNKTFTNKLQKCFDKNYFTINNEPDIAYPYLFTYIKGEEWRTAKEVHKILANEFNISPAGLPGNDDAGTISAWYVFSAMGFYPDCPGKPEYRTGSPLFDKIEIRLNPDHYQGESFIITTPDGNDPKEQLKPVKFNGKTFKSYSITHEQVTKGGELEFGVK